MSRSRTVWAITVLGAVLAGVFLALWQKAAAYANRPMLDYAQDRWVTLRYGDRLARESRELAGHSAIDCGRAPFGGPLKVNACVLTAMKQHVAFRARYVVLAVDARTETSLVRAADEEQCPEPLKLEATNQSSSDGGRVSCLANN